MTSIASARGRRYDGGMSTKAERHSTIMTKAWELADSGEFDGWLDVEQHIRFALGMEEARGVLDHQATRKLLDQRCQRAKELRNA